MKSKWWLTIPLAAMIGAGLWVGFKRNKDQQSSESVTKASNVSIKKRTSVCSSSFFVKIPEMRQMVREAGQDVERQILLTPLLISLPPNHWLVELVRNWGNNGEPTTMALCKNEIGRIAFRLAGTRASASLFLETLFQEGGSKRPGFHRYLKKDQWHLGLADDGFTLVVSDDLSMLAWRPEKIRDGDLVFTFGSGGEHLDVGESMGMAMQIRGITFVISALSQRARIEALTMSEEDATLNALKAKTRISSLRNAAKKNQRIATDHADDLASRFILLSEITAQGSTMVVDFPLEPRDLVFLAEVLRGRMKVAN